MIRAICGLHRQRAVIQTEIAQTRTAIDDHIARELEILRAGLNIIYHLIFGLLLYVLLHQDLVAGLFFFVFAFFRALLANPAHPRELAPIRSIDAPSARKILRGSGVLFGVLAAALLHEEVIMGIFTMHLLFAFSAGVILHGIVRRVLPNPEQGHPPLFLAGIGGFLLVVYLVRLVQHHYH
jgi:hypothetical protein